jgi:hypothetical protein
MRDAAAGTRKAIHLTLLALICQPPRTRQAHEERPTDVAFQDIYGEDEETEKHGDRLARGPDESV